ncbi:protein N-lysine methyltransferase family protein [Prosthecochloris sp. SCSIO W1101]|uniref:class I SAM-dependent methyltransferase n=1 Tax=Prosthecochloris sp. SCSIO W1101 TaxID=2992242 RepID=UPI00223E2D98|nr:methyltransferase domain-containing protein [Prosthecochloris sp. SCSIO W1101]UZJ40859.1 protein N-lysine methyltransferase family protein [Prosthecochloris sp. SCSIO W1101]
MAVVFDELSKEYDLETNLYNIVGKAFTFVSVCDSYALLDRISPEDFVKDEQMPYWAEIWPAAVTLSEFIVDELAVAEKKIIEIGAGVGVASVVAASRGADVLSTDYSEEALRFIQLNSLKNDVSLNTAQLDWRCIHLKDRFDMLFAADVLYERVNLLPIVHAVDKLVKPEGCAYIADPRRRLAEQFLDLAFENGFSVASYARSFSKGKQGIPVNIYRLSKSIEDNA